MYPDDEASASVTSKHSQRHKDVKNSKESKKNTCNKDCAANPVGAVGSNVCVHVDKPTPLLDGCQHQTRNIFKNLESLSFPAFKDSVNVKSPLNKIFQTQYFAFLLVTN